MKIFFVLLGAFLLTGCIGGSQKSTKEVVAKTVVRTPADDMPEKPDIQYTDKQLEAFLDSVGHLPAQPLMDKVAFGADSVFRSHKDIDTVISIKDFNTLKRAARKGVINVDVAKRILKNPEIDSKCTTKDVTLTYHRGFTPVVYYPFGKNKNGDDQFGICFGDPGHCPDACLYFFKGQRIIGMHKYSNRFSPKVEHLNDGDGNAIVYYCELFDEGSGICWSQYNFYKYDGGQLVPVLNIPQRVALFQASPWGVRQLWFETTIEKNNPLIIKMVYHQQLPDTVGFGDAKDTVRYKPMVVNDSTVVEYLWDDKLKSYQGDYGHAKITEAQILSYYLTDNEKLFVNVYYDKLKLLLKNKADKRATLHYLNKVKNHGL